MRQVLAVVIEFLNRQIAFKGCHQVLSCDTMAGFVEEDRQHRRLSTRFRKLHEAVHDADFRNGIERSAGVSAQSLCVGNGREENNRIATDLDVLLQSVPLFRSELRVPGIKRQGFVLIERNRELGNRGHRDDSPSINSDRKKAIAPPGNRK